MTLQTEYLGLSLASPLVVSASPLSKEIDKIRRIEEAGAGAIVLHSLFEEQILAEENRLNENLLQGTESFAEALSYFPDFSDIQVGPKAYLNHVEKVKSSVKFPVIASLNGVSTGGWIEYAKKIESAGADALELNIFYIPTNPGVMGNQVEQMYTVLVKEIINHIRIPVAVKVSPYFSATANILKRLDQSGAKGLVLFNRFYQPDFDIDLMEVKPRLRLSTSDELTLRLRWTAILSHQLDCDIAITGGVHNSTDVIKSLLAGARVAMMTSAVLMNGISYIQSVLNEVEAWMSDKNYPSVESVRGILSMKNIKEPAAFVRANYMKVLGSYQ
jgi:dihydroorotate dehydrogenase (fumarate)